MDIIVVVMIITIAVTLGVWIVLITFLWWELVQLRKIRTELEALPTKLAEAVQLMDGVGGFSSELKDKVLPTFMEATSDVKVAREDMQKSIETVVTSLKGKPLWFDLLVGTLENRFDKRLKRLEDEIRALVSEK